VIIIKYEPSKYIYIILHTYKRRPVNSGWHPLQSDSQNHQAEERDQKSEFDRYSKEYNRQSEHWDRKSTDSWSTWTDSKRNMTYSWTRTSDSQRNVTDSGRNMTDIGRNMPNSWQFICPTVRQEPWWYISLIVMQSCMGGMDGWMSLFEAYECMITPRWAALQGHFAQYAVSYITTTNSNNHCLKPV
jgi:hypothetical protein